MDRDALENRLRADVQRARRRLTELRERSSISFEAMPHAGLVFDSSLRLVACNDASLRSFGCVDREELFDYLSTPDAAFSPLPDADGRERTMSDMLAVALSDGSCAFPADLIQTDGSTTAKDLVVLRVPAGSSFNICVYYNDRRPDDDKDERREEIVGALNRISRLLTASSPDDFRFDMRRALDTLAEVTGADRVIVWRLDHDEHNVIPAHSWPVSWHDVSFPIALAPHWVEQLLAGRIVMADVANAVSPELDLMNSRGERSVLWTPITMSATVWGAVAFAHTKERKIYSAAESSLLTNAGLLFASAILRAEMASDLIRAKGAALQSAEAKTNFLANMSHEIRTPMNAIMGMTSIARSAHGDVDKIEQCLAKIEDASRRMMTMISEVLDMARLDTRNFSLFCDRFSLREMMHGVSDIFSVRAGERDQRLYIRVDHDLRDEFIGDAQRIGQVISNLVSNAIKFSPTGSVIRIEARKLAEDEQETQIEFRVADPGIGIPPSQLSSLFSAFGQHEIVSARAYDGLGLGLAIAKNIVEVMGGTMSVESKLGRGSTFSFEITLPHCEAADGALGSELIGSNLSYIFDGKKILVADDIEINREIIVMLLEETGAQVIQAENGERALEIVETRGDIDLIFMDINMPEMDGYEAARRIRAMEDERIAKTPIIALTANAFAEDIAACRDIGMDDHLSKPIDPAAMMKKAFALIGGRINREPND